MEDETKGDGESAWAGLETVFPDGLLTLVTIEAPVEAPAEPCIPLDAPTVLELTKAVGVADWIGLETALPAVELPMLVKTGDSAGLLA